MCCCIPLLFPALIQCRLVSSIPHLLLLDRVLLLLYCRLLLLCRSWVSVWLKNLGPPTSLGISLDNTCNIIIVVVSTVTVIDGQIRWSRTLPESLSLPRGSRGSRLLVTFTVCTAHTLLYIWVQTAWVVWGPSRRCSSSFRLTKGTRQDSVISPTFWVVYCQVLLDRLRSRWNLRPLGQTPSRWHPLW